MTKALRPDAVSHPRAMTRLDAGWLLIGLVASLLVIALVVGRLTDRLDYIVYDTALAAVERAPPDDIAIIAIDNASLQAIGHWPWPRRIHAQLLERLAEAKPRSVGYDVLFIEPTPDDRALAEAVARNRTYLPLVIDVPGSNGAAYDLVTPAAPIAAAAAGLAQVNLHFDGDRVIRKIYLEEGGGGRSWLQLGALMAGAQPEGGVADARDGFWQKRPVLIPYGGTTGHIPSISFIDLLNGRVPPELLAGRHVLIGATADGLGDSYPTPTSGATGQMPGVEIQAHLLDALLRGDAIVPASSTLMIVAGLGTVWLLLGFCLWLRPWGIAVATVAVAVTIMVLTFGLLRFATLWLPPTPALAGLLFVISAEAWRERQRLRETLVRERIATAAVEGELQAARNIQLGMLPPRQQLAELDPRIDLDALLEPAKSIGGDLYDVVRIDADRIAFLVGDVTGKGVPAALFMALSKALAKSVVLRGLPDLARVAETLNAELMRDNSEDMNLTMLLGVIDLSSGEVRLMSAGHEHPLHVGADGSVAIHRLEGGPPFCITPFPYPDEGLRLLPDESLVIVSDGVNEALDGSGALFGHARLLDAIRGAGNATAMIESIRSAVRRFEAGTDPTDDLTVMALRFRPRP